MPITLPQLFEALTRLRTSWPKRGWSWDNRFNTVASTFGVDLIAEARTSLANALPNAWTDKTLATAPVAVQEIAKKTGGVRAAQAIFGGEPVGRVQPYGLWWPWEEGRTISIRIGLENASQDHIVQLCSIFGCEP